jgi:hypothetical protein
MAATTASVSNTMRIEILTFRAMSCKSGWEPHPDRQVPIQSPFLRLTEQPRKAP